MRHYDTELRTTRLAKIEMLCDTSWDFRSHLHMNSRSPPPPLTFSISHALLSHSDPYSLLQETTGYQPTICEPLLYLKKKPLTSFCCGEDLIAQSPVISYIWLPPAGRLKLLPSDKLHLLKLLCQLGASVQDTSLFKCQYHRCFKGITV